MTEYIYYVDDSSKDDVMRRDAYPRARDGHLTISDSDHDVMTAGLTGMGDRRRRLVMGRAPRWCGVLGLTAGTDFQPCRRTDGELAMRPSQDALRV